MTEKEKDLLLSQPVFPPLKNDVIIRACRREPTPYTPVWIMRQAGRYLPEFNQTKGGLDFFTVCRTPSLVCELTLQPLKRFALDAAIIFSDILVIPQVMGMKVEMKPGKGPVFLDPLVEPSEIDSRPLIIPDVSTSLGYVFEAITITRNALDGSVPLIGFAGAPWTLMAYMIDGDEVSGGVRTYVKAKRWLYRHRKDSQRLLSMITDVIVQFLIGQVKAGAQLLQVFDSLAGELSPELFEEFALPSLQHIAAILKSTYPHVPLILFARGVGHRALESLSKGKWDVLGIDWSVGIEDARAWTGDYSRVALQGNLDPCALYSNERTEIFAYVEKMLGKFGPRGHIANLGHGLHPEHSPEHVKWFVDAVHELSTRKTQ